MPDTERTPDGDRLVNGVISSQLEHFRRSDPPCRGIQLPEGLILRHTQSPSLYFFLRTLIENGAIWTHIFASDSPYDRQKAAIGSVSTPMFDVGADYTHLRKVEDLIRSWVDFIQEDVEPDRDFESFTLKDLPH